MTAASGAIAIAKDLLRETLATCTAIRTWQGASYSIAQARARIYLDALPEPAGAEFSLAERAALRPFALVYKPTEQGVSWTRHARPKGINPRGTLLVYLEQPTPIDTTDPGEIDRRFENMIGRLVSSSDPADVTLATLGGESGYLDWREISESGPHRAAEDERPAKGDFQFYHLQLEWGTRD